MIGPVFDAAALQAYLRTRIPLAAAMQIEVLAADAEAVRIGVPLAPNTNQHGTAFGGSVATLAMLTAWSLLHVRLQAAGIPNQLVIQRGCVEYERPIAGAFSARSSLRAAADWPPFVNGLRRRGKARIAVRVALEYEGATAARFDGEFVALGAGTSPRRST